MREIANWGVFVALFICGIWDWKKKCIPLVFLLGISGLTIGLAIATAELGFGEMAEGLIIGAIFFLVSRWTKEAIGYGDSWLILFLGIYLGGHMILRLLTLASFAAGVWALFVLWKNHWKKKATIPFVPFLVLGYIGVVLV